MLLASARRRPLCSGLSGAMWSIGVVVVLRVCVADFDTRHACSAGDFQLFQQHHQGAEWLGHLKIEVRAYHDAGMLEVGAFQSQQQIQARYQYPNHKMHQQDEKAGQNRFLADWLEHCLENGCVQTDLIAPFTGS